MNKEIQATRNKQHIVTIESLVPQNHFLRKLHSLVDFSFIYDEVSGKGNYPIDPVIVVKFMLIAHLYDIQPMPRIEQDIQTNMAYRWFLQIDLDENVPSYETVMHIWDSWGDGDVGKALLACVLRQCEEHGLPHKQGGAWDYVG